MGKVANLFIEVRNAVKDICDLTLDVEGVSLTIRCYKAISTQVMAIAAKICMAFYIKEANSIGIDTTHAFYTFMANRQLTTKYGIEAGKIMVLSTSKDAKEEFEAITNMALTAPRFVATPFRLFFSNLLQILRNVLPAIEDFSEIPNTFDHYYPDAYKRFVLHENLRNQDVDRMMISITHVLDDELNDGINFLVFVENHNHFVILADCCQDQSEEYENYNLIMRTSAEFDILSGKTYEEEKKKRIYAAFMRYLKQYHSMFMIDPEKPWHTRDKITLELVYFNKRTQKQLYPETIVNTIDLLKPYTNSLANDLFRNDDEGYICLFADLNLPQGCPGMKPIILADRRRPQT